MINPVSVWPRYVADGLTFDFAYTYKIFSRLDLTVYIDDDPQPDTQYVVSGVGDTNGGLVTFVTAPVDGAVVTILPNVPLSQLSQYTGEPFPPARIEKDFDRALMACQMLAERLGRALTFNPSSAFVDQMVDDPIETYFLRAKTGGGFDWATLTAIGLITVPVPVSQGGTGGITVDQALTNLGFSAFIKTLLGEPDEAAVRLLLGALASRDDLLRIQGSGDQTKQLAFEVDGITTGTTRTVTVQDKNGTLPLTSEFDYSNLAGTPGRMPFPAMWLQGLTYANNAGDATNDLDIAAGQCRDATNAHNLILSALTKRSDAIWVVGTNQGMLDTGAVGDSDYYLWAIKRSDTGVCDVLCSLSSTAPTMPANYDFKRLIGWFKRAAGAIVAFHTYEIEGGGIQHAWDVTTLDINLSNTLTTSRRTDVIKVPLNFSVIASIRAMTDDAAAVHTEIIQCPDEADAAPSTTAAPGYTLRGAIGSVDTVTLDVRTSATGTIAARSTVATVDTYRVITLGFRWARRN